ncbi:MAG: hypothetical protein QME59_06655, partial [Candidatus Hydrothermarchaeota archaeon]|nr:hypothetical protein [Candidatus Hydrothermarchaeota archaeon]
FRMCGNFWKGKGNDRGNCRKIKNFEEIVGVEHSFRRNEGMSVIRAIPQGRWNTCHLSYENLALSERMQGEND